MSVRNIVLFNLPLLVRVAIALMLAVIPITMTASTTYAQDGGPGSSSQDSGTPAFAGQQLVDILYALARLVLQVVVFGSVALLAANIARGTFSAQIANLIGSPMGVSQAWMNILGAVFTFVVAVMSPVLVGIVFDIVKNFADTSFTIPTF